MASNFGFPAYGGKDKRVFISYKKADEAIVSKIALKLHERGVNVWYDMEGGEGLRLGEEWEVAISQNMTLSSVVISFVSRNFFSMMGYMRNEFNMAHKVMGKPMIVVFLDDISYSDIDVADRSLWSEISSHQNLSAVGKSADEVADELLGEVRQRMAEDTRDIQAIINKIKQESLRRKTTNSRAFSTSGSSSSISSTLQPYAYAGIAAAAVLALALIIPQIGGSNDNLPEPEYDHTVITDSFNSNESANDGTGNAADNYSNNDSNNDTGNDANDNTGNDTSKVSDEWNYLRRLSKGDTFTFGVFDEDGLSINGDEPLEWTVLSVEGDRMLVITTYAIDCNEYDEQKNPTTWKNCSIRTWLNSTFINDSFSNKERGRILSVDLTNGDNPVYGTDGGASTNDRVFLLSAAEVERYLPNDYDMIAKPTDHAKYRGASNSCWWWLRTPGIDGTKVAYVKTSGGINYTGETIYGGGGTVRPAMYIDLS